MAIARVSFVLLGNSQLYDGAAQNVIKQIVGAATTVTGIAATALDGPVAPNLPLGSGNSRLHARVRARSGNIVMAASGASQTSGIELMEGEVEVFPVNPGDKLSFVELA